MPRPGPATAMPSAGALPRPLAAFLVLVITLAAVGAYLAAGLVGGAGDGHPAAPKQVAPDNGFAVGDSVYTSFGAVAVEAVEKNRGLTPKELSGVTHGIQGLIPRDKVQVQAFATMTNLTGGLVQYSPAQFSLLVGSKTAKPLPLTTASVKPGVLQPNAAIDVRLSFVVPRKGQKLWVRFKDPARKAPYLIDLGRVTTTPQGPLANSHTHG
jgi:hypothetical protein